MLALLKPNAFPFAVGAAHDDQAPEKVSVGLTKSLAPCLASHRLGIIANKRDEAGSMEAGLGI